MRDKLILWFELVMLFGGVPLALTLEDGPRWAAHTALWLFTAYALIQLRREPGFSWGRLWHGDGGLGGWQRQAVVRFLLLAPLVVALAWYMAPDRFFAFPRERTVLWVLVMLLYPLLSVVPQEIVFRSFFFARYGKLLPQPIYLIGVNAFLFGFVHLMFHNWVAPLLSLVGGAFFAAGYARHRSLKAVALEHAAYGCLIFTAGLGWFFLKGMPR